MKAKELRILFVLMILSVSMTGWACASNRVNLLKDGTSKLEIIPSKGYYISKVHVNQNGDELEITGRVKRRSYSGTGGGHVDITIVNPKDEVLEKLSTFYVPRMIPTKRMHTRESRFEVRLPTILPTGSKVRVAYHRVSKQDRRTFSCGENGGESEVGGI